MPETLTCEICGRPVYRKKYYIYQGLKLILCDSCARRLNAQPASDIKNIPIKRRIIANSNKRKDLHRTPLPPEELQYDLIQNYWERIRSARKRMGLDIPELASRLRVSASYLKKIESGELSPDLSLARRIERVLNIKILRKIDPDLLSTPLHSGDKVEPVTLGDILIIEKPKKQKRRETVG